MKNTKEILVTTLATAAGLIGLATAWLQYCKEEVASVRDDQQQCNPVIVVKDNDGYFTGEKKSYAWWYNPHANKSGDYKTFDFIYTIPMDTDSLKLFFQYRANAYHRAVEEICREKLAFRLDEKLVRSLNEETNRKDPEIIFNAALDKIFVGMYDSVTYDCQNQRFVCKLGIGYPIRPEAFMNELVSFIKQALEQLPGYRDFKKDPLGVTLDVGVLLKALHDDAAFRAGYDDLVDQFDTQLSILRLSVKKTKGNYPIFFDSGEYDLNPVSMVIIGLIAQEYKKCIQNYPRRRFRIIAEGFADGVLPGPNGIPYNRKGRWSEAGAMLSYTEEEGEMIGAKIAPGETGNRQLAYARGYEGMRQLQTAMESAAEILQKAQFVFYGIASDAGQDPNKRRVSFKIQQIN